MPSKVSSPASSAASARIDGVPVRKRSDPVSWPVIVVEREGLGMAHPALKRGAQLVLQPLGDEDEGRRARAAVQIFVAAADREVAAGAVEVELDRAGAVRQVPDRQRAGRVRRVVDRAHVVDCALAIIDVGQRDDGGVVVDRAQRPRRPATGLQLEPEQLGDALRDIEVGREIAPAA